MVCMYVPLPVPETGDKSKQRAREAVVSMALGISRDSELLVVTGLAGKAALAVWARRLLAVFRIWCK